jgi:hypothetical protein
MALGGINAGLNVNTPSGTSSAGLGDEDLRSIKTTFQQVLDSEHIFPSTGGAGSGAHRKGSAVAFVGTASAVSSTDTDGRLMVTSDTSRLYHVGSAATLYLGGRYDVEGGVSLFNAQTTSRVTSTVTQIWGMEAGVGLMTFNSLNTVVTLANTYLNSAIAVVGLASLTSGEHPYVTGAVTNTFTVGNQYDAAPYFANSSSTYYFSWVVVGIKAG